MSTVQSSAIPGESRTLLIAIFGALALCALWFIVKNALHYANYSLTSYTGYFWPRRAGLIPHITGGVIAITSGLVQLWLGLTNRTGKLHRTLGKVYAAGILVGCIGGYYMALTVPSKYLVYGAGLFALATAWLVTTSMALVAIRRRDFQQHREWMIRSYTVTFAFVTFRILEQPLISWHVAATDDIDAILAWACWAIPLLLVEPLIQARRLRRFAQHAPSG